MPRRKPPPNPFRWFDSSPEVIRLVVSMRRANCAPIDDPEPVRLRACRSPPPSSEPPRGIVKATGGKIPSPAVRLSWSC